MPSPHHLIDVRDDPPTDGLLVLLPVLAILAVALLVVSQITVDKQDGEVNHVEVGEDDAPAPRSALDDLPAVDHLEGALGVCARGEDQVAGHARGQAVGPRLQPVTKVVDVAGNAPPAGGDEPGPGLGLDILQVRDTWIVRVRAECVLLGVCKAEDREARDEHGEDAREPDRPQGDGIDRKILGLQAVEEGHPDEIAKGKHAAEAVGGDVHGGEDSGLHEYAVEHVKSLHDGNEDNAVSDEAIGAVLLGDEGAVEEDITEHAGTQLHEFLDVDLADEGQGHAGVQLATDKPVVYNVPGVTSSRKLAKLLVARLDGEGTNVYECGERIGYEDVGGEKLDVVVGDEGPDWEIGALLDGAGEAGDECEDDGAEACYEVLAKGLSLQSIIGPNYCSCGT